jgi:hypothetical protein
MLILASTSDRLQVLVGSAGAINVHASFLDNVAGAVNPGRKNTAITTTGVAEIVPPPLASVQRNVKTLHIHNHGTNTNVVTVQHNDGTIGVQLHRQTLQPNDTLQYIDEIGFGSVGQGGSGGGGGTTGDGKLTLKTVADAGWVMMDDGSIGNVGSGATTRANADTQALFTLLFSNINDANAPLLTSAGAATTRAAQGTALAAWAANCRMTLTKQLGRSICIAGAGAGLTSRTLGVSLGAETHAQSLGEMAFHAHSVADPGHAHSVADPTHVHYPADGGYNFDNTNVAPGASPPICISSGAHYGVATSADYSGISIYGAGTGIGIYANGGSSPMDIMNPGAFWNVMIKL